MQLLSTPEVGSLDNKLPHIMLLRYLPTLIKARTFKRDIEAANQKAAELRFAYNSTLHSDPNTIDLHGLTVAESELRLEAFCASWCAMTNRANAIRIITGAGHHSSGSGGTLMPCMQKYMRRMKWKVEEGGNGWFYAKPI